MICEVDPLSSVSTANSTEALIACGFRGTEDGDRYSSNIEVEDICDAMKNLEEFGKDKKIKAYRVLGLIRSRLCLFMRGNMQFD